jgi:predicted acetyltransferase
MMPFELRPATFADRDFLQQLHEGFDKSFDPAITQILLVENKATGMLASVESDNEIFLANLWLVPEFRGKKLGSSLLAKICREAAKRRKDVTLSVPKISPAVGLYERLGFKTEKEDDNKIFMRFPFMDVREQDFCLRKLTLEDEEAFRTARKAYPKGTGFSFGSGFDECASFAEYLDLLARKEGSDNLASGRVPGSSFFGFWQGKIVGRLSLRHWLNEYLSTRGGHIGYGVLPEFRNRGFATLMLKHGLKKAKEVGVAKALVTCDWDNVGSYKTIENCGGKLENIVDFEEEGKTTRIRRYWIEA